MRFGRKHKEKNPSKKHIHDVLYKEKTVDSGGKIYLPTQFRKKLNIQVGDKVELALFMFPSEIRIRKRVSG